MMLCFVKVLVVVVEAEVERGGLGRRQKKG